MHPFGDNLIKRDANILDNKYDLKDLDREKDCVLINLIENMIAKDPKERPPMCDVLVHPAFWQKDKILDFFLKSSDFLKNKDDPLLKTSIEKGFSEVVSSLNWIEDMDPIIKRKVKAHKKPGYDGTKISSLLRAIRNYAHHFNEKTKPEQKVLGELNGDFIYYWLNRFPTLLLHVYLALEPWGNSDYDTNGGFVASDLMGFYNGGFNFRYDFSIRYDGKSAKMKLSYHKNNYNIG